MRYSGSYGRGTLLLRFIEDLAMKKVRQLDKLVDELAKGRPMEKVLR